MFEDKSVDFIREEWIQLDTAQGSDAGELQAPGFAGEGRLLVTRTCLLPPPRR